MKKLSSPHKPYYNLRSNLFYVSGQSGHMTLSPISLNPDMKITISILNLNHTL